MSQLLYKLESLFQRVVPNWLFNSRYCFVYHMPCNYRSLKHRLLPKVSIRWAEEFDQPALVHQTVLATDRLKVGDRAAIAVDGERLIGVAWIARSVYRDWDTSLTIDLAADQAWLYGAWVHRDFRGQHIYSQLVSHICESLCQAAQNQSTFPSLLLAVDWSNGKSQKVHQAFGAKRVGSIYGFGICGTRHYRLRR